MNNNIPYLDQPCERCGSRKVLTKIHTATYFSGVSQIELSQIICVNPVCQKEFEINLAEKISKAEAIKLKREEAKAARVNQR